LKDIGALVISCRFENSTFAYAVLLTNGSIDKALGRFVIKFGGHTFSLPLASAIS